MKDLIGKAGVVIGVLMFAVGAIWGWAFLVLWLWSIGWYPLALILASIPFFCLAPLADA
jgi:hypothetical protein